jgi:hypothetical protein
VATAASKSLTDCATDANNEVDPGGVGTMTVVVATYVLGRVRKSNVATTAAATATIPTSLDRRAISRT